MNTSYVRGLMAACAFVLLSIPGSISAQSDAPASSETTLATIEGPLSREGLNEVRLAMAEQDIKFNYGNFRFNPQDGQLIGAELFLVVDGVEYREYHEFTTSTCVLRILKESGFRMEGC